MGSTGLAAAYVAATARLWSAGAAPRTVSPTRIVWSFSTVGSDEVTFTVAK